MEELLELLREKDTYFEKISGNEIIVPVTALVATKEQYENNVSSSAYINNPLFCDEAEIHLTFEKDRIDWIIILPPNQ